MTDFGHIVFVGAYATHLLNLSISVETRKNISNFIESRPDKNSKLLHVQMVLRTVQGSQHTAVFSEIGNDVPGTQIPNSWFIGTGIPREGIDRVGSNSDQVGL